MVVNGAENNVCLNSNYFKPKASKYISLPSGGLCFFVAEKKTKENKRKE